MTSKEFVIWLKGFSQGVHHYNITPAQWDYLKEVLADVKDEESKTYVNPYNYRKTEWTTTSTQTPPYSTGGDDEFIKKQENEN